MIDLDRQLRFARLSGDFNPLHVDPPFARRTIFGESVVHGIHLALWAMEQGLRQRNSPEALCAMKVRFQKALPLNAPLAVEKMDISKDGFTLRSCGNYFELTASFERNRQDYWNIEIPRQGSALECLEKSFEEALRAEGEIELYLDRDEFAAMFPQTAAKLPAIQIAQILATTRLTGMVCPGMRSIFHDLDLVFQPNAEPLALRYRNQQYDPRFSIVRLAVQGYGVQGTLAAFFDPAPVNQASMAEVAKAVHPGEFRRQKALVIGGSRGLGELTAKIIAAGGGAVRLTYHQGKDDASRVLAELRSGGADADGFAWDVLEPDPKSFVEALANWTPSHLYYFASPHLAPSPKGCPFSNDKFDRLRRYYVHGLRSSLDALQKSLGVRLHLFYPSTALLDSESAGWEEFAAAKAEGDKMCHTLQEESIIDGLHAPRLPWLPTDQTVGLRSIKLANAQNAILPEIRTFNRFDVPAFPPIVI